MGFSGKMDIWLNKGFLFEGLEALLLFFFVLRG